MQSAYAHNNTMKIAAASNSPSSKGLLGAELQTLIENYLADQRKTLAILARECSVSYSTLRRMAQNENMPDFGAVIAVLGVICDKTQAKQFLAKYYPKIFNAFDAAFLDHPPAKTQDLTHYLDSELAFAVLQMSAQKSRCTRAMILKSFGEFGRNKLQEFIEAGYIGEDNHGNLSFLGFGSEHDVDRCLSNIRVLAKVFDESNLGTDAAFVAAYSESVTREGLRKIKQYGREYYKSLQKIIEEHEGDIPVYIAWMHTVSDVKDGVL